jgi:hypothetical protein
MLQTKPGIAAGILLTLLVVAAGGALWWFATPAAEPLASSTARGSEKKAAAPKEKAPSPREKAAAADKRALDELTKAYALRDEEDLKCVKPPYPESRKGAWHILLEKWPVDEPPSNAVFRWNKGELKHWGSILGAPGPTLATLLPTLAPLQPEEIEGDKDLLEERFEADFIVRPGIPAGNDLAAFTEKQVQEAHDPEAVLRHLTEQTGLSFKEEKRSVRVLFVDRKE